MSITIGNPSFIPMQGSGGNTTLHTSVNRTQITAHNIQNNAVEEVSVSIYRSTSSNSADGDIIDTLIIAAGSEKDVTALIGQGLAADEFIVGVVNTGGIGLGAVVSSLTYTEFTAGS